MHFWNNGNFKIWYMNRNAENKLPSLVRIWDKKDTLNQKLSVTFFKHWVSWPLLYTTNETLFLSFFSTLLKGNQLTDEEQSSFSDENESSKFV